MKRLSLTLAALCMMTGLFTSCCCKSENENSQPMEKNDIVMENVGHLVLHQANKFMTDFIAKRIKYPLEKVPYCLDKFGNTSSPSIPLTISSELYGQPLTDAIISGFGAGLSWGTAHIDLADCKVSKLIEY